MPLWAIVGVGRTNVCTNESAMPGGNVICFSAVSMQRLSGVSAASEHAGGDMPGLVDAHAYRQTLAADAGLVGAGLNVGQVSSGAAKGSMCRGRSWWISNASPGRGSSRRLKKRSDVTRTMWSGGLMRRCCAYSTGLGGGAKRLVQGTNIAWRASRRSRRVRARATAPALAPRRWCGTRA